MQRVSSVIILLLVPPHLKHSQLWGKLGSEGVCDNKMRRECRFSNVFITPLPFKPPWRKQLQSMLLPHVVSLIYSPHTQWPSRSSLCQTVPSG